VNRVDPSAYPVATLEDHDPAARGGQMLRGGEPRDPRAQHENPVRGAGRRAIRSEVP
jgi:hypothetical protein